MFLKGGNRAGQLTIFIILAILIVAIIIVFFVLKKDNLENKIPQEFTPVYNSFLSCIKEDISIGIDILETQGGYIYLPEYEPGSLVYPFSSQLNFVGISIPYWYYVSGSGFQKYRVPTVEDMQYELEKFLESRIKECNFDVYYQEGMTLSLGKPQIKANIQDDKVVFDLDMEFIASKGEDKFLAETHKIVVDSSLGSLYESALKIYSKEQEDLFLEKYGLDVLNLYAPVDGVEFTCSPKVWEANNIFNNLEEAIELNTLALKISDDKKYFSVDVPVEEGVNARFINSRNWTRSFEVLPSDENILMAKPIGNQPGLGILGFCYVTYHFVYNINYPVLVQVYKGNEFFQFPLAVIIKGNKEREPLVGNAVGIDELELCKDKNTPTEVNVYNREGNSIDANISYNCFNERCDIGETRGGSLVEYFPQCVNGFVLAKTEGYADGRFIYTSVDPGQISIFLDKLYPLNISLKIDDKRYTGEAIVNFISDENSKSVFYPLQKQVELSQGDYEIQVYVYKNSSLKLLKTTMEQCVDVPRGTIGGMFGLTKKQCFDIEYPEEVVSSALSAGGKEEYSIEEEGLKESRIIEINMEKLPDPTTLQQLQKNYILFEEKGLEVRLI